MLGPAQHIARMGELMKFDFNQINGGDIVCSRNLLKDTYEKTKGRSYTSPNEFYEIYKNYKILEKVSDKLNKNDNNDQPYTTFRELLIKKLQR